MMELKLVPRNLVKLGQNSLVITLPKAWLNKNKLQKGDIVYTHEDGSNLVLSLKGVKETIERELVIEIGKKSLKHLKTEIISGYLSGYDVFKIKGDRLTKEAVKIKAIVHDLVGLEIIEETRNSLMAKELINIEKTSIIHTLRRVDYLIRGMFEDILVVKNKEECAHIYERNTDINRLTYLIYRIVKKALDHPTILYQIGAKYPELLRYRRTIFLLEKIGDSLKRMAKVFYQRKMFPESNSEVHKLIEFFKDTYLETIDAYYKLDKKVGIKIEIENYGRIYKCMKFLQKNPKYFYVEISFLLRDISRNCRSIARVICSN